MTIDEKVELVRKALEKGAKVSVYHHEARKAEDAETFLNELGLDFHHDFNNGANWAKHESSDYALAVTVFYDSTEEPLPFTDEDFLTDDIEEIMKEDMRSEEYVSSFDLHRGEGL